MNNCKTCKYFTNKEKHEDGFFIGLCDKEPFDVREMERTDMAVQCGHDGSISVGEDFGCVNYERKESLICH